MGICFVGRWKSVSWATKRCASAMMAMRTSSGRIDLVWDELGCKDDLKGPCRVGRGGRSRSEGMASVFDFLGCAVGGACDRGVTSEHHSLGGDHLLGWLLDWLRGGDDQSSQVDCC